MIKNNIEKAMKKRGRSEEWVRQEIEEETNLKIGYTSFLDLRKNRRRIYADELLYIAEVLDYDPMSLIYKE